MFRFDQLMFCAFFEFIKWRTRIFTIDTLCLFTAKKVKMRLNRAISCVRCMERMRLQHVHAKDGFKNFDREICVLKIRHALADQPRLIRIKLRC